MIGHLEKSGIGEPIEEQNSPAGEQELSQRRRAHNIKLIAGLRPDTHAEWLLQHTKDDARVGRMSTPVEVDDQVLSACDTHVRNDETSLPGLGRMAPATKICGRTVTNKWHSEA